MESTSVRSDTSEITGGETDSTDRSTHVAGERTDSTDGDGPLISFFIPDLTVGGAEQVTVNIVNGLSARGHNVELLLSRTEGKLQSQIASHVRVVELPPDRTSVFGVAAHLPALISYIRRTKPAALVPHLSHPSIVCLTINRFLETETKVIPTHHSAFTPSTDQSRKDRIVNRLVPHLYPSADRIIAVSDGVADSIAERTPVNREDISVLHNPVEIESVQERAREPVDHRWVEDDDLDVVLFVGRIAEQKDLETWLRAFERIHESNPDTRGIIAGQGPHRDEILALVEKLALEDVVSVPGYVENPFRFMDQASVFLLSSQYEGLPTVLIEALACGCPVVATDCPSGPREILADGTYGKLVPVGDVTGLADAVSATLADPIAPERLRERANEFRPEAVFDDYEQFIETYITPA